MPVTMELTVNGVCMLLMLKLIIVLKIDILIFIMMNTFNSQKMQKQK